MGEDKFTRAMKPVTASQVPRPPRICDGRFYTVRVTDTLASIARKFQVTVDQILATNPQIVNPDIIFVGQVICIPTGIPEHKPLEPHRPHERLRVLSLRILSEGRQPLPVVGGAVQLNQRVIVRATFSLPVFRAFFFLEPTGTETCELARLIGIDCPGATVAEILWQVPPGTLGRVFVVGCTDSICAKSQEILVVRNT